MANIWILGDSWGTQKGLPVDLRKHNPHLEQLLEQQGHSVTNFSIPGGSNGQTIDSAIKQYPRWTERTSKKVDYLIWFHTESLRDRDPVLLSKKYTIMDLTRTHARRIYAKWKHLIDITGARDIILGGQAPVIKDLLVHEPHYLIEDWRCELLGIPSIMTHSVCHSDLFENPLCRDSHKERLDMLAENEVIIDMERDSDLFPDNAHPGSAAHAALFERISNLIC